MAQITNLRLFRKRKARDDRAKAAHENATLYGRTKEQRLTEARDAAKAKTHLDAHHREREE